MFVEVIFIDLLLIEHNAVALGMAASCWPPLKRTLASSRPACIRSTRVDGLWMIWLRGRRWRDRDGGSPWRASALQRHPLGRLDNPDH
jgi:hypothetical protein